MCLPLLAVCCWPWGAAGWDDDQTQSDTTKEVDKNGCYAEEEEEDSDEDEPEHVEKAKAPPNDADMFDLSFGTTTAGGSSGDHGFNFEGISLLDDTTKHCYTAMLLKQRLLRIMRERECVWLSTLLGPLPEIQLLKLILDARSPTTLLQVEHGKWTDCKL